MLGNFAFFFRLLIFFKLIFLFISFRNTIRPSKKIRNLRFVSPIMDLKRLQMVTKCTSRPHLRRRVELVCMKLLIYCSLLKLQREYNSHDVDLLLQLTLKSTITTEADDILRHLSIFSKEIRNDIS